MFLEPDALNVGPFVSPVKVAGALTSTTPGSSAVKRDDVVSVDRKIFDQLLVDHRSQRCRLRIDRGLLLSMTVTDWAVDPVTSLMISLMSELASTRMPVMTEFSN